MIPIGTLLVGLALLILGAKGFTQSGFPISKTRVLKGKPARRASWTCLAVSVPVLLFGGMRAWDMGVAWGEYLAEKKEERREQQRELAKITIENRRIEAHNRGVRLFDNKNYRGAADAFASSLKIGADPDTSLLYLKCWIHLDEIHRLAEECDLALQHFDFDAGYEAVVYAYRGYAHYRLEKYGEAIDDFTSAIQVAPPRMEHLMAYGFRGWIYAACPDSQYINPRLADADADYLVPKIGHTNWIAFDQSAAMCARAGNFEAAQNIQDWAIKGARDDDSLDDLQREQLLAELHDRMQLYKQGKPYREDTPRQGPLLKSHIFVLW